MIFHAHYSWVMSNNSVQLRLAQFFFAGQIRTNLVYTSMHASAFI